MPGAPRRRKRPAPASASASEATTNNNGDDGDDGANDGRFKIIAVPRGGKKLGLTIEFSARYSGALIRGVDPRACGFADRINVGDRIVTCEGRQVNKAEDLRAGSSEGGGERRFGIVPAGSAGQLNGLDGIDSFLRGRGCMLESANVASSTNDAATEGEGSISNDLTSFCASMKSYMISQIGMRLDHLKGTRGAVRRREELLEEASEDFPFLKGVDWTVERRERLRKGDGWEGADVDDNNGVEEIKFKSCDEGAADVSLTVDEIREAATEISGRRTRAAKQMAASATSAAQPEKEDAHPKKGNKRKRASPRPKKSGEDMKESFPAAADDAENDPDASNDGSEDPDADTQKPPGKKRARRKANPKKPGIVSFDQRLRQCKAYKENNGHLSIPSHYRSDDFDRDAEDFKLGTWAEEMRDSYRRYLEGEFDDKGASRGSNKGGKHTVGHRVEVLEEMGFNFEFQGEGADDDGDGEAGMTSPNDAGGTSTPVWDYKIERCREFKAENGHLNIPIGDKCLGHFADRMRALYKRRLESGSKKSSAEKLTGIERDKVQFLESMGFAFDGVFDVNLQRLEAFKAENGHTRVPIKYLPDRALGHWAEMVRREHNRTNRGEASDYLTADRLRKLATAGFTFSTRKETPWEVRFERLREYRAEHGRDPPISHPEMGNWVQTQRFYYCQRRKGKLRVKDETWDEREDKLRNIGFVFQVGKRMSSEGKERMRAGRKISWDERLADFIAWKERHGHPYVPTVTDGEDKHLGRWVAAQRMAYRAYKGETRSKKYGKLTAERALKLANAGFAFDAKHIQRTPKAGVAAAGARAEEEEHHELEEPRDGHYNAEEEAETDWGAY